MSANTVHDNTMFSKNQGGRTRFTSRSFLSEFVAVDAPCAQAIAHSFAQQGVHDGKQGDINNHPDDAHGARAQRDSHEYPDGRQPDRASDHMRIDQIALHLLQNQKEDQKPQCL